MTKRNIADIRIGGLDYSKYFTFPFVIQDTGTEQLDSAVVELRGLPTDDKFPPFTPVVLCGGRYSYVIADDTVTEVFGRSLWNHQLTLIDETKTLERILMEGKSFTQPLVKEVGEPKSAKGIVIVEGEQINETIETEYKTPIKAERYQMLTILPARKFAMASQWDIKSIEVLYSRSEIAYYDGNFDTVFYSEALGLDDTAEFAFNMSGIYTIKYNFDLGNITDVGNPTVIIPISIVSESDIPPTYSIYDVMSITLETAEPILKGEAPRYGLLLTPEQETRFKAMDAPEMHFPNGRSLYENLKEIGDYIHALPKAKTDINGNRFVYWKELGSAERADLSKGAIYGASGFYNAADYASAVEANFANLINASDESEGSVTDPYSDGYITLRSNSYRIKEEDSYIPTNFPIGTKIKQVIVRIHDDNGMVQKEADITSAVFEKNEYDLLSGFSGAYPFSKTHALYYTTGQKNIEGLWYRPEDDPVDILNLLNNYAITNVINHFCGTNYTQEKGNKLDFTKLSFQVTYIPIINGRARQERTESTVERVILAHNQSGNQLSARAFGENLRGKVAMLGNSTDAKMYIFPYLDDIPKAGTMYDRKEFISLVTTRVFPDYCLSRIDFSTNYNNQGAFVQMKTGIRQYEIPAGQDRCTLLEEFCVIGKDEHVPRELGMLCQSVMCDMTLKAFYFTNLKAIDITSAYINTLDDEGIGIAGSISLPAYSTSLGASVYFGFSFEDNFSAGKKSIDIGKDLARGTEYVEYGSQFYSKAKYLDFSFTRGYVPTNATPLDVANRLPIISGVADTIEGEAPYISTEDYTTGAFKPLVWNKDSADIGNVAYQLHFVSNDGYIIGSELARMMPYIRTHFNYNKAPRVYFYDAEIEELTGEANGNVVAESDLDVGWEQSYFLRIVEIPSKPYKSFVIKRPGGECIIGKNTDSADELIHFNFKRKR